MKRRALLIRAALILAATSGVAACRNTGSDAPTESALPAASAAPRISNGVAALAPAEILDRARAALKKAKFSHLQGTTIDRGSRVAIDIEADGSNATGVITVDTVKLQVLEVGGEDYVRADKAGGTDLSGADDIKAAAAAAELLVGRWVLVRSKSADFASFFGLFNPDKLLNANEKLTKGTVKKVDGVEAIGVVDSDQNTVYVAASGEPYPLSFSSKRGTDELVFSELAKSFPRVTKPTASVTVTLA